MCIHNCWTPLGALFGIITVSNNIYKTHKKSGTKALFKKLIDLPKPKIEFISEAPEEIRQNHWVNVQVGQFEKIASFREISTGNINPKVTELLVKYQDNSTILILGGTHGNRFGLNYKISHSKIVRSTQRNNITQDERQSQTKTIEYK